MNAPVSEPALTSQVIALVWVLPFVAYYVGITIRKITFPSEKSAPLVHQYLLGIPVGLVLVSPTIKVFLNIVVTDRTALFVAIGIVMEHGMFLQEEVNKLFDKTLRRPASAPGVVTEPA